jgi:hypothetical protein
MSRLDEKRFMALGQEWIARFGFNAQCAIEEETGKGFYAFVAPMLIQLDADDAAEPAKVMAALSGLRKTDMRLILRHALSEAHDIAIDEVGDIIQDIGDAKAMEVVAWAIARAMPAAGDDEEAEGNVTASPAPNRQQRRAAAKRG